MAPAEPLAIPIEHPALEATGGLFDAPRGKERGSAVLLAHGAGSPMDSEFMTAVALGLAEQGFPVLRFDYPYMQRARDEGRRRPPDPAARLEACHQAARAVLAERCPGHRLLLAGKSLGGRMGSRLAARGEPCAGLVLLGYPLHPPGRPEGRRSEHFPAIAQPALFLQGSRDSLGSPEELAPELETFGGRATLVAIEDADHGFKVPKRAGLTRAEVLARLVDEVVRWEERTFPD